VDNHQEDNFREDNHKEEWNGKANRRGDRHSLSRKVHVYGDGDEDKSKSVVVDKLVLGTGSPFTRRVENY
jgi:hypothetical protein